MRVKAVLRREKRVRSSVPGTCTPPISALSTRPLPSFVTGPSQVMGSPLRSASG